MSHREQEPPLGGTPQTVEQIIQQPSMSVQECIGSLRIKWRFPTECSSAQHFASIQQGAVFAIQPITIQQPSAHTTSLQIVVVPSPLPLVWRLLETLSLTLTTISSLTAYEFLRTMRL